METNEELLKELIQEIKTLNEYQKIQIEKDNLKEQQEEQEKKDNEEIEKMQAESKEKADKVEAEKKVEEEKIANEKQEKNEQELLDFRNNINESLEKINSKSYSLSIENLDTKLIAIEKNTARDLENEKASETADILIIALIFIVLPIFSVIKFMKLFFDDVVA